jgi:hypothetical protein
MGGAEVMKKVGTMVEVVCLLGWMGEEGMTGVNTCGDDCVMIGGGGAPIDPLLLVVMRDTVAVVVGSLLLPDKSKAGFSNGFCGSIMAVVVL